MPTYNGLSHMQFDISSNGNRNVSFNLSGGGVDSLYVNERGIGLYHESTGWNLYMFSASWGGLNFDFQEDDGKKRRAYINDLGVGLQDADNNYSTIGHLSWT